MIHLSEEVGGMTWAIVNQGNRWHYAQLASRRLMRRTYHLSASARKREALRR